VFQKKTKMDWLTFISENEVLNPDNPNSFLCFLHNVGVGSFYQMSLFDPINMSIFINTQILQEKKIDTYEFLLECQTLLQSFGYKCQACDEADNALNVEEIEHFKFKAKNPLRFIFINFNGLTDLEMAESEELDILQCMINPHKDMRNPEYICTELGKQALQNNYFDVSVDDAANMDWEEWFTLMNLAITIENHSNFKFQNLISDFGLWELILHVLPMDEVIKHIIEWNTMVKTANTQTNIPMFLLTVKTPNDAPRTSDVLVVIVPKDQRYIWNIHWHKLTYNQKLSALPLLHLEDEFSDKTPVKLLIQESKFESVFLPGQIPSTCLDIINNEMEQDLNEFIKEDPEDNIVFLFPLKNQEKMAAACYHKSYLSQSKIFYTCKKEDSMNPKKSVRLALSIFQIHVREFPIYIDQNNMEALLESDAQFFIVNETPHKTKFTVSKDVIDGRENMVSGDHCQARSDKTLSRILPISADSLEEAVSNVQGNPGKWRKKYPTHIYE
jgi:hypothetical protein